MVKRFENKGLLPALSDPPDVFEEKLNNLTQEMAERYKASDASLRYGVHISPYDLQQLEQGTQGQGEATGAGDSSNPEDYVLMRDPITGKTGNVHKDWVQDAIDNDGLELVNE